MRSRSMSIALLLLLLLELDPQSVVTLRGEGEGKAVAREMDEYAGKSMRVGGGEGCWWWCPRSDDFWRPKAACGGSGSEE